MEKRKGIQENDHTRASLARHCREGARYVCFVINRQLERLHREGWRSGLYRVEIQGGVWGHRGVEHQRDAVDFRRQFIERFQPFGSHRPLKQCKSCDIAPGMCQGLDETLSDRIRDVNEYDGKRAGRIPCGSKCWCALSDN